MKITFLGHAGFLVETDHSIVIMDAWLSKYGAFDGGWFQFPRNHHMAKFVKEKLAGNNGTKGAFVYVSHEHKDHFDIDFLKSIEAYDFEYIIPKFRRTILYDEIDAITNKNIRLCEDNGTVSINKNEYIRIYTDDSELNRDSAILFSSHEKKFLNLNDCKIHDRLGLIKQTEGSIDLFSVQFSGATWHPTCYEYSEKEYARISRKKKFTKFEATAIAIENVSPKAYIPAAGPACFLDPDLIHINFQKENIFPRNEHIIEYLGKRLKKVKPDILNANPGDIIELNGKIDFSPLSKERVNEGGLKNYILNYAKDYEGFFNSRKQPINNTAFESLMARLVDEFREKLSNFKSKQQIERPLYMEFSDHPGNLIEVNFQKDYVETVSDIPEEKFYLMKVNAYDVQRVMDGYLTWEDFSLTFRMLLNREPDIYQVLMQGFLILEKDDLNYFCDKILEIENRTDRIVVEVGGCKYSVDRYCPHQGADLSHAWKEDNRYLVCPRHRWAFDLEDGGQCKVNSGTINAIPLEPD